MDPNATLAEIRELDASLLSEDPERLVELVRSLDGWLTGGGCLPAAWDRCRTCGGSGEVEDPDRRFVAGSDCQGDR
jgi:hypothetical protein